MSGAKAAAAAVVLVVSVLGLVLFGVRSGGTARPAVAKSPEINVPAASATSPANPATSPVVAPPRVEERSFTCQVYPRETVAAGTRLNGAVGRVLVNVGDVVRDGQVLAVIGEPAPAPNTRRRAGSTGALEARLLSARRASAVLQQSVTDGREKLASATADFEKKDSLNREGAIARVVFEAAKAQRDSAASELAAAEALSRAADNGVSKLEDEKRREETGEKEEGRAAVQAATAEIHAPEAGMIVERNIAPGERVTDANRSALFRIAQRPELLRAVFETAVRAGQSISITAGAVTLSAEVGEDGKSADFESRMGLVRPGSPCKVTIK